MGTVILHPSNRLKFSKDRHITPIVLNPLWLNNVYFVVKVVEESSDIE